jgi:K+-sensing histidine kinase KdpD
MDEKTPGLDAVLAKMAHDLRTPLSVVHTTTNMLLNPKYKFSEQQVREQHERIQRNVQILDRLVSELSDLAHSGAVGGSASPRGDGE